MSFITTAYLALKHGHYHTHNYGLIPISVFYIHLVTDRFAMVSNLK